MRRPGPWLTDSILVQPTNANMASAHATITEPTVARIAHGVTTVSNPRNERHEPDPASAAAPMRDRSTAANDCEPGKKCMLLPTDRYG